MTLSATLYTSKKLELELAKSDLGVAGLTSTLKLAAKSFEALGANKDAQSVSAEFEYLHERATMLLAFDLFGAKPQAALALTGQYEQFTAGVDTKYSLGSAPDLAALGTAVHYDGGNWTATVLRSAAAGFNSNVSWLTRLHQKIDDRLAVGAEVAYKAADSADEKASAPVIAIGGQYKGADIKAKCSTGGVIGLSYTQPLNYFTKLTLGVGISPVDFSQNRFGASFTFKN